MDFGQIPLPSGHSILWSKVPQVSWGLLYKEKLACSPGKELSRIPSRKKLSGKSTGPHPDPLPSQVTLSYGGPENPHNVVNVAGFSLQQDPTR